MRNLLQIIIWLSLSSCATIMNGRFTDINIYSKNNEVGITLNDTTELQTPLTITVPRSYDNLKLSVRKDSIKKIIEVKSKISNEFKFGNLAYIYLSPIAFMVDAKSMQNIYGYNKNILIDFEKSTSTKYTPSKKGLLNLVVSVPYFNFQNYKLDDDRFNNDWFMGLSTSIEYFHSSSSYISFTTGFFGINEYTLPFERFDPDTTKLSAPLLFIVQNHNQIHNFALGYGIAVSRYNYHLFYNDYNARTTIKKTAYWALGLNLSTELKIIKDFYIGVRYSPTFYNIEKSTFEYSDITSIEFKYKIKIKGKEQPLKKIRLNDIH